MKCGVKIPRINFLISVMPHYYHTIVCLDKDDSCGCDYGEKKLACNETVYTFDKESYLLSFALVQVKVFQQDL